MVNGADLVLPDGIGIIKGAAMLGTPLKEKTPGVEFAAHLMGRMAKEGLSLYLLGAKPGVAELAAEKLANYYGVILKKLDLSVIFADSDCSLLQGSTEEIPKESYADQLSKTDGSPVSTYVPFRNGLFLSAAASVALSNGCEKIYYGAHSDDAAGNAYPDCSQAFNDAINTAIYVGSGNQLSVVAPFIGMTKAEVVAQGVKLNVPYEMTWSCYEGNEKPCGVCGTCRDRIAAFRANGIEDIV